MSGAALFVRFAESDPAAGERRAALMEAHKAHLRQAEALPEGFRILMSGPMQPEDGEQAAAIVIAQARSVDDFVRFSEADPFVRGGVYGRVRILRWTPTLCCVPGLGAGGADAKVS